MEDPDLELVLKSRNGDAEAFGELVSRHQAILAAMLHRFSFNHADLEDMLQDVFIKAWTALPGWEAERPFLHWLKRIAARTGLEYCRKRKRSPLVLVDEMPDAPGVSVDHGALDQAKKILSHLGPDDRALLTLVHLHGMSMEEAAGYFGWSRAKAKVKAFRARHALRKILKSHGYHTE